MPTAFKFRRLPRLAVPSPLIPCELIADGDGAVCIIGDRGDFVEEFSREARIFFTVILMFRGGEVVADAEWAFRNRHFSDAPAGKHDAFRFGEQFQNIGIRRPSERAEEDGSRYFLPFI